MSIVLNNALFQKLNNVLALAIPSRIVKRGNAFSFIELNSEEEIKEEFKKYQFDGLNLYNSQNLNSLKGECFFIKAGQELEFDAEVSIQPNSSLENFKVDRYILDLSSELILVDFI